MSKSLKAEIWQSKSKPGLWHARIVEQSHIGKNFGKRGAFLASNGVTLRSDDLPEWVGSTRTFYVWGSQSDLQFRTVTLEKREATAVERAIGEYNRAYGGACESIKLDGTKKYEIIHGTRILILCPQSTLPSSY